MALVALGLACGGSGGGGTGSGGEPPQVEVSSPDARCAALPGQFPAGFDFVPGLSSRVVVANFTPPALIPFDVSAEPPAVATPGQVPSFPADTDGDGCPEPGPFPCPATGALPDGVQAVDAGLALVTASGYEEVIFARPQDGTLRTVEVSTPAGFAAGQYFFLPAPGTSAFRTAVSTSGCIDVSGGALDSRGDALAPPAAAWCLPGTPSFRTTFTSGVAVASGRLFVSMSNLGDNTVPADAQYLPGAVLVYDVDLALPTPTASPNAATPVVRTLGFNPTHVTPHTTPSGRSLVLVTVSGAVGIRPDDPGTAAIEGGGVALTDASIEVIDAQTLQLVATVPLGRVGLSFDRLAVDPGGRVALTGTAVGRALYGIDLAPLDALPPAPATPVVLDGSGGPDARLFFAGAPFLLPPRPGGAPAASCNGFVVGVAWNDAGSQVFATEFCDGTLSRVSADLSGSPDLATLRSRFRFEGQVAVTAPVTASAVGEPRALGTVRVRPGAPGVAYSGPDVYVTVGQDGLLCGLRVEAP